MWQPLVAEAGRQVDLQPSFSPQMQAGNNKGGARRCSVPPTDLAHLEDLLAQVLKQEGTFNFRSYQTVGRTQALGD